MRENEIETEGPTDLQERVLIHLELAGFPEQVNDRITRIIGLEEQRQAGVGLFDTSLTDALAAVFPYTKPSDDPDQGRAAAQRIIMAELGLKVPR